MIKKNYYRFSKYDMYQIQFRNVQKLMKQRKNEEKLFAEEIRKKRGIFLKLYKFA
jgi:hypothetical protein